MKIPLQQALDFEREQPQKVSQNKISIDIRFPIEPANRLAKLESYNKHLFRPNTYLHKWWARRSGTTFRYILKQLASDQAKRGYYEPGGLEGKIILDPMMGGGTTIHEAIRMGANVIGVDIDPIPVLQTKAGLSSSPLYQKEKVFAQFLSFLKNEIGPLYKTTCPHCTNDAETQFTLYGLRKHCSCGEVLFVDDLLLREGNHHNVHICPTCQTVFTGERHNCSTSSNRPLVIKGTKLCEACHNPFEEIVKETFSDRYIPLVVVGICREHGQFFKTPTQNDLDQIAQARQMVYQIDFGSPEVFLIPRGPKSNDLINRGIKSFLELFTPRQLLYLNASIKFLQKLSETDRLWLALLVSTSLEFNSLLCGYKGSGIRRPGAIRHVFSHHAYSFPYTALENNPSFSGSTSGTPNRIFRDRIIRAAKWAARPSETRITGQNKAKVFIEGEIDAGEPVTEWKSLKEGERKFFIFQGDSSALDIPEGFIDYVITDPPYYDSVQYSDLSNFFRVWLRLFLPNEADWTYNPLTSAVSEGNAASGLKYSDVLGDIWKCSQQALKKNSGRLIFTFHHWRHDAWAELTVSLKRVGFLLANRYVVFSENPTSVHIKGLNALKHDAILVLKPKSANRGTPKWQKRSKINTIDSYSFCRDCGEVLGWFLLSNMSEEAVRNEWKRLLGGNNNAKTPI